MTSHEGLCAAVAKLCGGADCAPSSQCARAVDRQDLRNLIYRRHSAQLFSPAAVISEALGQRPAKPEKKGFLLSSTQARLLSHFRELAADEPTSFFAIPQGEFSKLSEPCWCLLCHKLHLNTFSNSKACRHVMLQWPVAVADQIDQINDQATVWRIYC